MTRPELWIVAGPNGAGKTTCVQREPILKILPAIPFHNPDDRTLAKLRALGYRGFVDAPNDAQTRLFFESADEVIADLRTSIASHHPVGVETVLSSEKYHELVDQVNCDGGYFRLIYVALSSPAIACERVAARVRRGGHGIPADRIASRWQRSLDNLAWFVARASAFWIVDNSNSDESMPLRLLATGEDGRLTYLDGDAFPEMKAALSPILVR